jgi:hypothetical protein
MNLYYDTYKFNWYEITIDHKKVKYLDDMINSRSIYKEIYKQK